MLTIRIEVVKIDYERCIRSLMERFQMKIQTWSSAGIFARLLEKLGGNAPDIFCCLSKHIPNEGKGMLICELANQYQEKLTEASNKALASNDLGKNIVFGQVKFEALGEELFICARNVQVNYSGIMGNEDVKKKVEDTAQWYLDSTALGKKLPGLGSVLKGRVSSAARFAAVLMPGEIEKKALQLLAIPENKAKLTGLLEKMLVREGLVMKIGEISILNTEAESKINHMDSSDEHMASGGKVLFLSAKTEEMLLNALSEYLKSSVYGNQYIAVEDQGSDLSQYVTFGAHFYRKRGEVAEVIFIHKARHITKTIVDDDGHIHDFSGFDEPEEIKKHLAGRNLPKPTVCFRTDFNREPDGRFLMIWEIQPDGRYWEDEDGFGGTSDVEVRLYSHINEWGCFTDPFRIYNIGVKTRYHKN